MIQHLVLLKWKSGVNAAQKADATEKVRALQTKIPGITSFSGGNQCSPEGLGKGFQYGFVVTFVNAAARDAYLIHPEHKKVVEVLLAVIEDVVVLDYEA